MNINIQTLRLGELDTNCYLIWDEATHECVIIDPADEGDFINSTLLEKKLTPIGIWLTHGHLDHILGLLEVKLAWNIPIWANSADNFLIESVQERAQHWFGRQVDPAPLPDHNLTQDSKLKIGEEVFKVLQTPGHTPGSVCFYSPNSEILISGDTIFKEAIGRSDFSYSKPLELAESVQELLELPPSTVVLPGHGETTTIENEQKFHL